MNERKHNVVFHVMQTEFSIKNLKKAQYKVLTFAKKK